MGKNKIGIIISREYSVRVKKKSFILTTVLIPILFAAMIVVPVLITLLGQDKDIQTIAVYDQSSVIMQSLENSDNVKFVSVDSIAAAEIKKDLSNSKKFTALMVIAPLDSTMNTSIAMFAPKQLNMNLQSDIRDMADKALEEYKLRSCNIPDMDKLIDNIQSDTKFTTFQTDEQGSDKETNVGAYMAVGYIASFIIYMFIFMFGGMVMRGVIEEKNNRIVEVIVSSVKPMQLMMGKIIGIALVAVTQFLIWIALTGIIVGAVIGIAGSSVSQPEAEQTMQAAQNIMAQPSQTAAGTVSLSPAPTAAADSTSISGMMGSVKTTISNMNLPAILGSFIIYFILGYLLYSSMFAAVGSCVDNEADTQQLMLPITIPLIIGLFIMLNTFQYPDSSLSVWASIIPFTSPMVMMARVAYGVPAWQYILSVALLIITFIAMAWLSGKIYRIGILSYGKKAGWKEIGKWLKFKD